MHKGTYAVIGAGKVGTAIACLLKGQGYQPVAVASRSCSSARQLADNLGVPWFKRIEDASCLADIVLITTSDGAIGQVVETMVKLGGIRSGQVLLHFSGALSAQILAPARECGASVGSIHPLQSFADLSSAMQNLPGTYFAIEGDNVAVDRAWELAQALGGNPVVISTQNKPLYHAAACMASNYLITIYHQAVLMMRESGFSEEEAEVALLPLVQGTINNLQQVGLKQALTGPIARGDVATVQCHLETMNRLSEDQQGLYRRLGRATIPIAVQKGAISPVEAIKLEDILRSGGDEEQNHNPGFERAQAESRKNRYANRL